MEDQQTNTPNLDRIRKIIRSGYIASQEWKSITFYDRSMYQLGVSLALCIAHDNEGMATSLVDALDNLNNYGNTRDVTLDGADFKLPRWQVSLGDDGTLGGWSILWFAVLTDEELEKSNTSRREVGKDPLRVRDTRLTVYGTYANADGQTRCLSRTFPMVFDFSGGLLLHGFGEVFAVELSTPNHPHWSIHT